MAFPEPIAPLTGEDAERFMQYMSHGSCGPEGCDGFLRGDDGETCAEYRARLRLVWTDSFNRIRATND